MEEGGKWVTASNWEENTPCPLSLGAAIGCQQQIATVIMPETSNFALFLSVNTANISIFSFRFIMAASQGTEDDSLQLINPVDIQVREILGGGGEFGGNVSLATRKQWGDVVVKKFDKIM